MDTGDVTDLDQAPAPAAAPPEQAAPADPIEQQRAEAGEIVASARAKRPNIEIIARAHYDDEVAYITDRGANQVVMGEREIANSMLNILQLDTLSEEEKMGGCPI